MNKTQVNSNRILFDVNTLVDPAPGTIRFMLYSRKFSKAYFEPIMISVSDEVLKQLIVTNLHTNPLAILFKEKYYDSIDNIYKEIREQYYKEILQFSMPTGIMDLCNLYIKSREETGIYSNVNCDNELEKNLIDKLDCPVLVQEYSMKNYDNLFIANVEDAEKYTDIKNALQKNITIVDKGRNLFKDHRGNIVLKFDEAGYFPCITKTIDYYTGIHLDREELFNEQDHLLKYRR